MGTSDIMYFGRDKRRQTAIIFICPFQFNWLYCFLGCIFRPPFQDASDTVLLNFSDSQAPLPDPFLSGIFRVALLFICQGPSGLMRV